MEQPESVTVGGYRVVRKLGEGPRADVYLGYPAREGSTEAPAAIKVFRRDVTAASIIGEVDALDRAAGSHVVAVRDVLLGPVNAIVLERLPRGGLTRLLMDRRGLGVGESITILVPLLEAVSRLHSAGCSHGALTAESVLFSRDGAPVLVGFGAATLFVPGLPPARLAEELSAEADLRALAVLARSVLDRVDDDGARRLADWLLEDPAIHPEGWCEQLTARLFDLGDAAPIEFDADPGAAEPVGRAIPPREIAAGNRGLVLSATGLPEWLEPMVDRFQTTIGPRAAGLLSSLRSVRPVLWATVGAVTVALTAAMILVPGESAEEGVAPAPTATPDVSEPPTDPIGPEMADDPVAAAVVLLQARRDCFRDLSVICLDAVAQQGSAALASDQTLLRDAQNGGELAEPFVATADDLSIVERTGDAVLLEWIEPSETQPASLLLMKGEAGWRIRDYLA